MADFIELCTVAYGSDKTDIDLLGFVADWKWHKNMATHFE